MDEGPFPTGTEDEVTLFWRLKDFASRDTARLWPLDHKMLPGTI